MHLLDLSLRRHKFRSLTDPPQLFPETFVLLKERFLISIEPAYFLL
jgi:hypothetical protein